ncbi:MAG TPA: proton-conducting transporter membrane subunit, partial [Acetobacteraceae bacterium]|nr:proton-conducting transporter membrane subunit [Acetobacteraceae bacterium]
MLYPIAVFAPLVGSLIAGLLGRVIGDRASEGVTILCMAVAAACGVATFVPMLTASVPAAAAMPIATWIQSDTFHVEWDLRYDALSAVMVAMVTFVSMLIHIYSIGYMAHDKYPRHRFFSYLSLFTFAMLMLVTSNNLVQLFFGWEGVGLVSYLLIGYWYDRPSACAAAIKAMIVNRIGDLMFALGIALVFFQFDSISFPVIFGAVPGHEGALYHLFGENWRAYEVIGVLLFFGAMGKSAQLFLHTWLPDAMEGPTPVSALIHAATMVTAGVFLMARMSPILEFAPTATGFITFIGSV